MDENLRSQLYENYITAYDGLNARQREAVDAITGPVMVIAGPGTGKTQLLAVRVCHIVQQTGANPEDILCLTYTDAGASAMRKRLISFMGAEAYKVNIFTFHSFCNYIINGNRTYFGDFLDMKNISDLQKSEIMREILDELSPDHSLKRLTGSTYFDSKNLLKFFSDMKREKISKEQIETIISEYLESLKSNEDYYYKKNSGENKKGDLKIKDFNVKVDKYQKVLDAYGLLESYNEKLKARGSFDFDDSILFVIEAFKKEEVLLQRCQEKFQYILVDEYQDTNGSQNELTFLLADNEYHDRPDIFIVGDEDQSIYRFQGANMGSIIQFQEKYNPKVIFLEDNYRSYQGILDSATRLIDYNKERISNDNPAFTKRLIERRKEDFGQGLDPLIYAYDNTGAHDYGVIDLISKLRDEGTEYKDIAVLYSKHADVTDIIKYLTYEKIPITVKRKINILEQPEIKRVINLLGYLAGEYSKPFSQDDKLFEILHYDYFGLSALEVGKISYHISRSRDESNEPYLWRTVLADQTLLTKWKVGTPEQFKKIISILEDLIHSIPNMTVQAYFEKVITVTGLLQHVLISEDTSLRLQMVNTLFNFIKEESSARGELTIQDLLRYIDILQMEAISMPMNHIITNENGVNFMTIHGAKGLEYKHVIVLNVTDKTWPGTTRDMGFSLPPNQYTDDKAELVEERRRLFYVAITRAKNRVYLCYPTSDTNGKDLIMAPYISEMNLQNNVESRQINDGKLLHYTAKLLQYEKGTLAKIDHQLIDQSLENLVLSATAITRFLTCPRTYYFVNILKVPSAPSAYIGQGNALHHALEKFYNAIEANPTRAIPSQDLLNTEFNRGLMRNKSHFTKMELENARIAGLEILDKFYQQYKSSFTLPRSYKTEYKINGVVNDIKISGILDRVDIFDDHVDVVDYKTGKYKPVNHQSPKEDKIGGKYWTQIVLYKLLMDMQPEKYKPTDVSVLYLHPKDDGNFEQKKYVVTPDEIEIVKGYITDVYERMKNHDFDQDCDQKDCKWCNFVRADMKIDLTGLREEDLVDYLEM